MNRLIRAAAILSTAALLQATPALAACEPGDKPDKTTATDARKRIEAAGLRQVSDLKKGCDNVWHATATREGKPVAVLVTPDGQVMLETNP